MQVLRRLFPGQDRLLLRALLGHPHFSVKSHKFGSFWGFPARPVRPRGLIIPGRASMLRRTKTPASEAGRSPNFGGKADHGGAV